MDNEAKHRILFVCHGNICRSPMAEFVMKDLVKKAGLEDNFMIESAATSTEEIGNSVYPPARRKLAEHGIGCSGKTARQMTRSDYDRYDLLIGMDSYWRKAAIKREQSDTGLFCIIMVHDNSTLAIIPIQLVRMLSPLVHHRGSLQAGRYPPR